MTYYVSYIQGSGELVGVSNTQPPILDNVYVAQYDSKIDLENMIWEPSTLSFITVGLLTKLEFLTRFTSQERISIRSSPDPIIDDFMSLLNLAENVNLRDTNTQNGIMYLVYKGIISVERSTQILK